MPDPVTDPIPMPDGTGISSAEALEGATEQAREMRQASEYMRPGLTPWTREEREHIEQVNARMTDGWADAYREQPLGGDHD